MEESPVGGLGCSSNISLEMRSTSLGRMSSRASSQRHSASFNRVLDSVSLTRDLSDRILGAIDSTLIAQAGDSGDRAVANNGESVRSSRARVDGDGVYTVADDTLELSKVLQSIGGPLPLSVVLPLADEIVTPLPSDAFLHSSEDKHGTLPRSLDYISYMIHLTVFGEFGVNTKWPEFIVSGVQFGFLGCLSTVSTFVAEVYAMRQSGHSGRALAYVAVTVSVSFALGTLVYSVPVWAKDYK